jgi:hypothetical protein
VVALASPAFGCSGLMAPRPWCSGASWRGSGAVLTAGASMYAGWDVFARTHYGTLPVDKGVVLPFYTDVCYRRGPHRRVPVVTLRFDQVICFGWDVLVVVGCLCLRF